MSDYKVSIGRIWDQSGKVAGAGFLVAPDLLVTCAHVVGLPGTRVKLDFPHWKAFKSVGVVIEEGWCDPGREDVAYLRLDPEPDGLPVISLRLGAGEPGSDLRTFGFPSSGHQSGSPSPAKVHERFPWIPKTGEMVELLSLKEANTITVGFSGSPLVDEAGFAVAMVSGFLGKDPYGKGGDLAFAVPAATLRRHAEIMVDDACPYPGLEPFSTEQARWFHGRSDDLARLFGRIGPQPGVFCLAGPSGSGKSSLVAAGLLPAWIRSPGIRSSQILRLSDGWEIVMAAVQCAVDDEGTLLVIDQFEETLAVHEQGVDTLSGTSDELLRRLLGATQSGCSGRILLVMRADFYSRLGERCFDLLKYLERDRIINVSDELDRAALEVMIEGPARSQGWAVDRSLTERLVGEMLGGHGVARATDLPLLAHSLRGLWEVATQAPAHDTVLTLSHWSSKNLRSAFAEWCEAAYKSIPQSHQGKAQALLTSLVQMGDPVHGTPDVRRLRSVQELTEMDASFEPLVEILIGNRLLASRGDANGVPTVELVHESLIDNWPRLRDWLQQDRQERRHLDTVERDADLWSDSGCQPDLLLAGSKLETAIDLKNRLNSRGVNYVEASDAHAKAQRQARESTERKRIHSRNWWIALLAIAVAIALSVSRSFYVQGQKTAALSLAAESGERLGVDDWLAVALASEAMAKTETPLREATSALVDAQVALKDRRVEPNPQALDRTAQDVFTLAFGSGGTLAYPGEHGSVQLWDASKPPGDPLYGHTGSVRSVAFSRDGTLLASGGDDGSVRLWDVEDRKQRGEPLVGDGGPVHSVAFSRSGRLLASGNDDGSVRLWDVQDRKQRGEPLVGDGGPVRTVAFSRDGTLLASGSENGKVQVWHVGKRQKLHDPWVGHSKRVRSVAFSPAGDVELLASGGDDGVIRLWDLVSGKQHGDPLLGHSGPVRSVAFSPDGRLLASAGNDRTIRLWDMDQGVPAGEPLLNHDGWVFSCAFSPDGRFLASSGQDGKVLVWTRRDREAAEGDLTGHESGTWVRSLAFSPDGERLASAGGDHTVRLWDASTGKPIEPPLFGRNAEMGQDGGLVESVAFNPAGDGALLASASHDGAVRLWDVENPQQIRELRGDNTERVRSVAFSPDGKRLASGGEDGIVRLWEIPGGKFIQLYRHDKPVRSVAFSANGDLLASAGEDGTIRIWNVKTQAMVGEPLRAQPDEPSEMNGQSAVMVSVAFNHSKNDRQLLVSGDSRGRVLVWDPTTGNPLGQRPLALEPMSHSNWVRSVTFSFDDRLIASAGDDGTVRLWEAASGKRVGHPLTRLKSRVISVAFSPYDRSLVSGHADGIIRRWGPIWDPQWGCDQARPHVSQPKLDELARWPRFCTPN